MVFFSDAVENCCVPPCYTPGIHSFSRPRGPINSAYSNRHLGNHERAITRQKGPILSGLGGFQSTQRHPIFPSSPGSRHKFERNYNSAVIERERALGSKHIFRMVVVDGIDLDDYYVGKTPYNGTEADGGDPTTENLNIWYESGDIAWMIAATALVLLMIPGVG